MLRLLWLWLVCWPLLLGLSRRQLWHWRLLGLSRQLWLWRWRACLCGLAWPWLLLCWPLLGLSRRQLWRWRLLGLSRQRWRACLCGLSCCWRFLVTQGLTVSVFVVGIAAPWERRIVEARLRRRRLDRRCRHVEHVRAPLRRHHGRT